MKLVETSSMSGWCIAIQRNNLYKEKLLLVYCNHVKICRI